MASHTRIAAAISALLLLPLAEPVLAQEQILKDRPVTEKTLLDRIQIEDLLTRFYYDLTLGKTTELAQYFTRDGTLDVDGMVATGHEAIANLYRPPAGAPPPKPKAPGEHHRRHMLLTNPIINVEGDIATAHVIWTGIQNDGIGKAPRLWEEGREYTELKKVDGQWLITRRYISSDSGMPDKFDATFKPREHRR